MKRSKVSPLLNVSLIVTILGCSEVIAPRSQAVLLPAPTLSKAVAGPPDSSFSVPATQVNTYLIKFPYDTWVTLESLGSVYLNARDPIPGASTYYVWPSRFVGGSGGIDPHPDGHCFLGLVVQDAYQIQPGFGTCGDPAKVDTILSKKLQAPWIVRMSLPLKHFNECSIATDICHSLNPGDASPVRERPVPVSLNKLKSNKQTSTFPAPANIVFTASRTPDIIHVGTNWYQVPMDVTLWQWIGADSTRNPLPWPSAGCHSPYDATICNYGPYESGRMIVKAFVGGYQQTNSVTVQCPVYDGDPALNDTTSDFRLRGELLDLLVDGNADSSKTAGWDASNPGGWRHEAGSVTWRLANGGGLLTLPVDDPNADACHITVPTSAYDENNPPVPGATVYSVNHAHVSEPGEELFCRGWTWHNWRVRRYAARPSDTLDASRVRRAVAKQDSLNGPSPADWDRVEERQKPSFVVQKNGFVYKAMRPWGADSLHVYRAAKGKTDADRRCAWAKKYNP